MRGDDASVRVPGPRRNRMPEIVSSSVQDHRRPPLALFRMTQGWTQTTVGLPRHDQGVSENPQLSVVTPVFEEETTLVGALLTGRLTARAARSGCRRRGGGGGRAAGGWGTGQSSLSFPPL